MNNKKAFQTESFYEKLPRTLSQFPHKIKAINTRMYRSDNINRKQKL